MPKSPLKSKTMWVNSLALLAGMATYLTGADVIKEYPTTVAVLVLLQAAANLGLRYVTKEPIR